MSADQFPGPAPTPPSGRSLRDLSALVGPVVVVALLGVQGVARVSGLWLPLVLVAVQSVPLLWRGRFPVPVLLVTVAGATAQMLWGLPQTNATLGQWVAVAAVVRVMPWPWSVVPPVALVCWLSAVSVVTAPAGGVRDLLIEIISAVVAWSFGDAQARRAEARRALAAELQAIQTSGALRAGYEAMAERLRISDDNERLLGGTLDGVLAQVRAARPKVGTRAALPHLAAVERQGRESLEHLDRFLHLLRAPVADPSADAPVPSTAHDRFVRRWSSRRARTALAVGPPVLLLPLALSELSALSGEALTPLLVVLTVLQLAPLAVRGRWPLAVAALVVAAAATQLAMGHPVFNAITGLLVALAAVAERLTRRAAVLVALAAVVTVGVPALLLDVGYATQFLTVVLILAGVGVYIGDAARNTQAEDDRLRARVARAEHDDQLRRKSAIAAERLNAARELHDSVGHVLSLVVLQAGAARMAAESSPTRALEAVDAIERASLKALSRLDASAAEAPAVEGASARIGTLAELPAVARDVRAAGVNVVLRADDTDDVPAVLQATAVRIVQEALTNVVKHAPGGTAVVTIRRDDGRLLLDVVNSAPPEAIPAPRLPSGRRGLTGMRERAALFGGRVDAGRSADGRFRVAVDLPLSGAEPAGVLPQQALSARHAATPHS